MTPISIVMPCARFDAKARRAVEALAFQMQHADEFILIMDGSDAPSGMDGRVTVLTLPSRRGPAAARNLGTRTANGDVLFFVDADVIAAPGALERVRSFFADKKGDAVFGCYDDAPSEPDWASQFRNLQHHHVHVTNAGEARTFWAGCGAVGRKAFDHVGGFDETYQTPSIEDIELGTRLTDAGYRITLDPDLRGTHLKRWPLFSMWRNDLLCRAIPWSRLILSSGRMPNGLNTDTLGRTAVACQAMVFLLLLLSIMTPWLLVGAFIAQVAVLCCHSSLLAFLARARGMAFAFVSMFLIIAYVVISGAGFAWALGEYLMSGLQSRNSRKINPKMEKDEA